MERTGIIFKVGNGRSWVKLEDPDGDTWGPGRIEKPVVVVEVPGCGGAMGDRVLIEAPGPASDRTSFQAQALLLGGLITGVGAGRVLVEIDWVYGRLAALAGTLTPLVTGDNLALAGGTMGLIAGWLAAGAWIRRGPDRTGKFLETLAADAAGTGGEKKG